VGAPGKFGSISESSVLEFGVGVDDIVGVTNDCEVSASRRKLHLSCEGLALSKLLNVLRMYDFPILGVVVSSCEQLEVESLDLVGLELDHLAVVEGDNGVFISNLDDDSAFIKAETNHVGVRESVHGPDSLEAVVKLSHRLIGGGTPHVDDFIFSTSHQQRQLRVENDGCHAVDVSIIKRIHTLAGLVIPNFD